MTCSLFRSVFERIEEHDVELRPTDHAAHSFYPFDWESDNEFIIPGKPIIVCPRSVQAWEETYSSDTTIRDMLLRSAKDPMLEAILLSHEYGHFLSYTEQFGRNTSAWELSDWDKIHEAYVKLRDGSWLEEHYSLVVREEELAWQRAFRALRDLAGDEEWLTRAAEIRDQNLRNYRTEPLKHRDKNRRQDTC